MILVIFAIAVLIIAVVVLLWQWIETEKRATDLHIELVRCRQVNAQLKSMRKPNEEVSG